MLDLLDVTADIEHCKTILDVSNILRYLLTKYLSVEGVTSIVRKKINSLKRPDDALDSLNNITEILKLIDTLYLNGVLFVIVGFLETKSFTMDDLVVYKKVATLYFAKIEGVPTTGEINIKQLTSDTLQRSKDSGKRDYLLKYLKSHMNILQTISNVQGLKVNKGKQDHKRCTKEHVNSMIDVDTGGDDTSTHDVSENGLRGGRR